MYYALTRNSYDYKLHVVSFKSEKEMQDYVDNTFFDTKFTKKFSDLSNPNTEMIIKGVVIIPKKKKPEDMLPWYEK